MRQYVWLDEPYGEIGPLRIAKRYNTKGAHEIYERLVVIDPLDAKSLYRLGEVLLELGETQRAFELRQRAGRLKPDLLPTTNRTEAPTTKGLKLVVVQKGSW